jgi:hypothetical protein
MNLKIFVLLGLSANVLNAQTLIAPIEDGYVTSTFTNNSDYILVGGNVEGALMFSTATSASYNQFSLEINPYGEPVQNNALNVYGFSSSSSTFNIGDYDQGTLLGTFTNLSSKTFGQESFLNITPFVQSVGGSYFGILLQAPSGEVEDIYSSTQSNDGQPSGILASDVPEPSTLALLLGSLGLVAFLRRFALHAASNILKVKEEISELSHSRQSLMLLPLQVLGKSDKNNLKTAGLDWIIWLRSEPRIEQPIFGGIANEPGLAVRSHCIATLRGGREDAGHRLQPVV